MERNGNSRISKRTLILALACLLTAGLVFLLAGCGSSSYTSRPSSGSSGSSSSSSSAPKAQDLPSNGHIFSGSSSGSSEIKVTASSSESVWVKVYTSSGKLQVSFFVRKGQSASVEVPSGTYAVHFACGTTWYGTTDKFGKNTSYGQDKSLQLGSNERVTYTLSASSGGNWHMGSLDASDF